MKDPAFLFYSTDFYEGTRMMLPEERACYVDLLIFQHQHGFIPTDLKRLQMYCSGIDIATLEATLEAKFKLTSEGWTNEKLNNVINNRSDFKNKLSVSGTIGQFWKKCKAFLGDGEYLKLRETLENIEKKTLFNFIKDKEINKNTLKGLLKALLKHIENENENRNENRNENENEKKNMPGNEKFELIKPFSQDEFLTQWEVWKDYKAKEHKFKYKTIQSEQAALGELNKISAGNHKTAIKILHQSMANGWKGIFELNHKQNNQNGNRNNGNTRTDSDIKQAVNGRINEMFN